MGLFTIGHVTSYSHHHRYGFVRSKELTEDIRFDTSAIDPQLLSTEFVRAKVKACYYRLPDGKLRASRVDLFSSAPVVNNTNASVEGSTAYLANATALAILERWFLEKPGTTKLTFELSPEGGVKVELVHAFDYEIQQRQAAEAELRKKEAEEAAAKKKKEAEETEAKKKEAEEKAEKRKKKAEELAAKKRKEAEEAAAKKEKEAEETEVRKKEAEEKAAKKKKEAEELVAKKKKEAEEAAVKNKKDNNNSNNNNKNNNNHNNKQQQKTKTATTTTTTTTQQQQQQQQQQQNKNQNAATKIEPKYGGPLKPPANQPGA